MDTLNIIILAFLALGGLIGAISGASKGLIRSVVKFVSIIVAIVAAFIVTPIAMEKLYEIASPNIEEILAPIAQLLNASPTLKEYIPTLAMTLVTPIVFVVAFCVCLLAVAIVRAIINFILKAILPKKPGAIGRLGGFVAGLATGVLVALCFVFPVVGYFNYVPTLYANVQEIVSTEENPIDPETEQLILNLPNGQGVQIVSSITLPYFDRLVSYTDGDKTVSAMDDLKTLTSLVSPALRFANSTANVETMDTQALKDIAEFVKDNTKLRCITAEILSSASRSWLNNQEFMGFNLKAQIGAEYSDALDIVLVDLALTKEATVVADLGKLANKLEAIKHLYAYANLLNSESATMADLEQKLTDVLLNLDSDSVEIINEIISEDTLGNLGVSNPELVLDIVVDVIGSAVENMSEEQTASDAAAINSIMHFAAGSADVSAEDVVEDIANSPAIVQAIADVVNTQNAPTISLSAESQQLVADALENVEDEQLAENLKKLFGIN